MAKKKTPPQKARLPPPFEITLIDSDETATLAFREADRLDLAITLTQADGWWLLEQLRGWLEPEEETE